MRITILPLVLLSSACGSGAPAVPFSESKARVITLKEECHIVGGPAATRGKCNEVLPKSRTYENRGSEVRRMLTIKYAYTGQDGELYEGNGELDQMLSSRVPRVGDEIAVWIDPGNPGGSRLTN